MRKLVSNAIIMLLYLLIEGVSNRHTLLFYCLLAFRLRRASLRSLIAPIITKGPRKSSIMPNEMRIIDELVIVVEI